MQAAETYAIIGAAMEVHRQLGHGFLEAVYQQALTLEFDERGIAYRREVTLQIRYKGRLLAGEYRADFVCTNVVVELKAVQQLNTAHHGQVINELKASGHSLGLLLNFGAPTLESRRFIRSKPEQSSADFAEEGRTGEEPGEYRVFSD